MAQPTSRTSFAPEAFYEVGIPHELRGNQLQGDITPGPNVGRQIHGAHSTGPKEAFEAVFVGKGSAYAIQRAGNMGVIGVIEGHDPDRVPLGIGLLHGRVSDFVGDHLHPGGSG
jgi:hypothetical protein